MDSDATAPVGSTEDVLSMDTGVVFALGGKDGVETKGGDRTGRETVRPGVVSSWEITLFSSSLDRGEFPSPGDRDRLGGRTPGADGSAGRCVLS